MTTSNECTVVIRYRPRATDGWPWAVTHDDGLSVLTITDLDDSSIGIILRALAQAGGDGSAGGTATSADDAELAAT
ncbi:MAG TPA: hypothetical protein VFR23_25610 [Jiangellaceae bacterium]|nr:hypothetical protein [Jiangellaceae bacterium]